MQQGDSFFYTGYMVYIVKVLMLPTNVPASAHRATLQQRFLILDALTSIQKQETVHGYKIFAKMNVGDSIYLDIHVYAGFHVVQCITHAIQATPKLIVEHICI